MLDDSMMIEEALEVQYLACATGGQGGAAVVGSFGLGGNGGGGGVLTGIMPLGRGQTYPVTFSSGNVSFNGLTAIKGGFGGEPGATAGDGGSGGEGGNGGGLGGAGTLGQGTDGADNRGGAGGAGAGLGVTSSISGSSVVYGRPGHVAGTDPGQGGNGGYGGDGDPMAAFPPTNGQPGVFLARYLGPQQATGGTITTSGDYTIHTMTASDSLTLY